MATYYVDNAGSNTSPYDTWAKAATSLATVAGVAAAGDTILVASTHSETTSAADLTCTFTNATITNPIKVISASTSTSLYTAGATIATDTSNIYDIYINAAGLYVKGLTIAYSDTLNLANNTKYLIQFDNCTLNQARTGNGVGGGIVSRGLFSSKPTLAIFNNCTFNTASTVAGQYLFQVEENRHGDVIVRNGTFTATTYQPVYLVQSSTGSRDSICEFLFEDCDLSAVGTSAMMDVAGADNAMKLIVRRCKIPASPTWINGTVDENKVVYVENCDDGTISVPGLGVVYYESNLGTVKSSLAQYRTGGADDGEQANAYSWEMASTSTAIESYIALQSPPITRWVGTGSQTLTLYIASGATLNDDDFWIEVSSPDEGGTPTAQGTFNTTKISDPLGTPTALTTDSGSTWNGTGVGTTQKIDVSINPAVAGPVTVRCYLAKPSTTVYVDPKLGVA